MAANEATGPSLTSSQVAPEHYVLAGDTTLLNAEAAAIWEQALARARGYLANLLSDPNREALFADVFGRAGTNPATFAANLQALLAALGGDGLRIAVELRSNGELAGAFAAYAASGHTGSERIYVNADKLNNGLLDVNLATSALLEELGHALDWRLNGGADSPGDEGQLFAAEVSGVVLTAEQRALIDAEDDTATLTIEGVQVLVEMANLYWDGTGTSWNAVGSWGTAAGGITDPAAVPGGSDVAYFSSLTTAQSVNLDANQAVTGLYFGAANTATTVIQAGGTNRVLSLGTGGITIASGAGAVTLGNASSGQNVAITLGGAQSWTNDSSSALTISNALNNGGYLLTSAGSGNTAIAGAISGSGAVTKVGAGSLMLSASNTFSGGLIMGADAGTVIADTNAGTNVSGLGSGAVAIGSGSTLVLRSQYTGSQTVFTNTFTGTGLLKLSSSTSIGGNRFHLYGINGFGGTVELAFSGSQSYSLWGTINAPNATLQIDSGNTLNANGILGSQTWKDIKVSGAGNAEGFGAIVLGFNAASHTVTGSVSLLGDTTIGSTDGGGTLNGAITSGAAGTQTLTLNTYQDNGLVLTRAIGGGSGTIALAKTQTGTTLSGVVTLSGANTYTGATTVSAGILNIQNANALGSTAAGTSVSSGAALQIQGNITTAAEALTLNGTGVSTDGVLRNISGNNNYAGLVTLASATRINSDAGTLTLSNAGTITGAGFGLSVGGAGNITIASSIGTGTGTLTKDAAGTLTLSGANTYSGLTTVSAGVLNIQNADALGTTATGTTVSSGAALQIQGDITTAAEALTLNGAGVSATGALRNISGNNSYAGLVTLASAARINSDAGTLSLSNTITGAGFGLSVGGAGNTTIASSIGTDTGTLTKDGAGTLTLSGANTYSGATTVNAGSLQIGNGSTTGSIATGSSITNNGTLIFNRSDTITQGTDFNSVISGGGAVTQSGSGTLVFTGANTFTGRTSVSAGSTLQIGNGGTTGSIATGSLITNNGTLVFNRSDTITSGTHFNSVISGTGAVTQSGSGTLVFTGANTFTGRTNVSEATTLQIGNGGTTGSMATGSSITNNGTLIFNRSDTITQGTHFNSVIGGTGALTQSGSGTLVLTGANTYSGATTVSAGSLNIQNANALGTTAAGTTVTSGAALQIQGNITTAAEALTLNGAGVSATGALRNISGNNTYAGLVTS